MRAYFRAFAELRALLVAALLVWAVDVGLLIGHALRHH